MDYVPCDPQTLDIAQLYPEDVERFNKIISPRRKCEFFYTRMLWKALGPNEPIRYDENNRPFASHWHLSISHGGNTVLLGQSQISRIGVDVELYSEKIRRVADKFMSPTEKERFGTDDLKILTAIWSAKESFFKLFADEHLAFAAQIEILRLGDHPLAQIAHTRGGIQYKFRTKYFENLVITWCVEHA